MNDSEFKHLESRFTKLGNLHDVRITHHYCDLENRSIEINLDDIYSNFLGEESYRGPVPAKIILSNIGHCILSYDLSESYLNIENAELSACGEWASLLIHFWPNGRWFIKCTNIDFILETERTGQP